MRQFRPMRFLLIALAATCHFSSGVQAAVIETSYLTTSGYFVSNVDDSGTALKLQLTRNSTVANATYGDDIDALVVEVTKSSNDAVRVKVADDAGERWQVPFSLYSKGATPPLTVSAGLLVTRPRPSRTRRAPSRSK